MKSRDSFGLGDLDAVMESVNSILGRVCWSCKRHIEKDEQYVRTRKGLIHSICHTKGLVALAQKKNGGAS